MPLRPPPDLHRVDTQDIGRTGLKVSWPKRQQGCVEACRTPIRPTHALANDTTRKHSQVLDGSARDVVQGSQQPPSSLAYHLKPFFAYVHASCVSAISPSSKRAWAFDPARSLGIARIALGLYRTATARDRELSAALGVPRRPRHLLHQHVTREACPHTHTYTHSPYQRATTMPAFITCTRQQRASLGHAPTTPHWRCPMCRPRTTRAAVGPHSKRLAAPKGTTFSLLSTPSRRWPPCASPSSSNALSTLCLPCCALSPTN